MSPGYLQVLLYIAGFTLTLAEPSVEIVDIFGDVLMQIGKPLTVKCGVSDSVPGGVFTWEIGNEKLPSLNSLENARAEEDRIVDSVRFVPEKKHGGQELRCEYKAGGKVYSDYITANIYLLEVPSTPVIVPQVMEGEVASLHLQAGIFPPPQTKDIVWTIRDREGEEEILRPGQQVGRYTASSLQPLSLSDFYMLSLNISNLDEEEVGKTHEVSITTSGTKRTISFELSMRFRTGGETETSTDSAGGEEKAGPQVVPMSIGFIIIIVIVIVVVILLCICCFCYRRNKKDEVKEDVRYSKVSQTNPEKSV